MTFPAPLQGPIGLESLRLRPVDPVEQLLDNINTARRWVEEHRPHLVPVLDHVALFTTARAGRIRAERPAVTHGDANLLNIIAGDDSVQLIDWDFPMVRYPLADLLLAHRIVGCLGWLSGQDWARWQSDPALPDAARDRLDRWHTLLLAWAYQTLDFIDTLA